MKLFKTIFSNKTFFKVVVVIVAVLRIVNISLSNVHYKKIAGSVSLVAIALIILWIGIVYGFTNWWDNDFNWKRRKVVE